MSNHYFMGSKLTDKESEIIDYAVKSIEDTGSFCFSSDMVDGNGGMVINWLYERYHLEWLGDGVCEFTKKQDEKVKPERRSCNIKLDVHPLVFAGGCLLIAYLLW